MGTSFHKTSTERNKTIDKSLWQTASENAKRANNTHFGWTMHRTVRIKFRIWCICQMHKYSSKFVVLVHIDSFLLLFFGIWNSAPHYYPSYIFKIEISCFNGLYKCMCSKNVRLHANTAKGKSICFRKNSVVCVQFSFVCPFYVNSLLLFLFICPFVSFSLFIFRNIICLPAAKWIFALHTIFEWTCFQCVHLSFRSLHSSTCFFGMLHFIYFKHLFSFTVSSISIR